MDMGWYVIHTQTGVEAKVKDLILARAKLVGKNKEIKNVLVPTENVSEVKAGKKRISSRKFFPGYVLIEMVMSDDNWYFIKNMPGVTGFVNASSVPAQLNGQDVDEILKETEEKQSKLQPKVLFKKGEHIKIVEGPFLSFSGVIEEVAPDKGKLRVMLSIFGRSTPVELEYWQVEKI